MQMYLECLYMVENDTSAMHEVDTGKLEFHNMDIENIPNWHKGVL